MSLAEDMGMDPADVAEGELFLGKPLGRWLRHDWERWIHHLNAKAAHAVHVADQMHAVQAEAQVCGCDVIEVPLNPDRSYDYDYVHATVRHSCEEVGR